MKGFIELTTFYDNRRLLVNCSTMVGLSETKTYTLVWFIGDEEPTNVKETYDEVVEKIKNAN